MHVSDEHITTDAQQWYFLAGDYLAGALIGAATALAGRVVVAPGMDMVIAMLLGSVSGMIVHLVIGIALTPLVGMFETMMPASLIGVYGGMLFGMRDSMAAGSRTLAAAMVIGTSLGLLVVAVLKFYDRILRGVVLDTGVD